MNIDFNSLETKRKINSLAELCHYGTQHNQTLPPESNGDYITGGIDTTAHIISCCIAQWFGFDCCDTGETRNELYLEDAAYATPKFIFSIEKWERLITKYLKKMQTHEAALKRI
jgi:hypothetical protein